MCYRPTAPLTSQVVDQPPTTFDACLKRWKLVIESLIEAVEQELCEQCLLFL